MSQSEAAQQSNSKLIIWLEKKIFPVLNRLNNLKFLDAVRESVFSALPLIVVSFIVFLIWGNPTAPLATRALEAFSAALGILGVWVSFYIPFAYSRKEILWLAIVTGLFSLVSFLSLFPAIRPDLPTIMNHLEKISQGGILFGFLIGALFVTMVKLLEKKGSIYQVSAAVALLGISLASSYHLKQAGFDIFNWIQLILSPILVCADTLPAAMVVVFLMSLFWLAGIHGTGVVGGAVLPFYLMLFNANVAAQGAGEPLPYIITPPFFILCMVGGTGGTLPLVFYMLFSKAERLRKIAKISILPSLVNVNEPLVFGVPLILNPIIAIPFVLTPVILCIVNYMAMAFHLVDRIFIIPLFAIPMPLYAYLGTLDVRAVFLSLLDIAIACVMYYPFYRALEKSELEREQRVD